MADPFRAIAHRERVRAFVALTLLAALLCGFIYLQFGGGAVASGRVMKAEVLRLGTYPTGSVKGANLPIITVRLPDGSVRDVKTTRADVSDCKQGDFISVLQRGDGLQAGQRGCTKAR
jgi:hypothetical protein